MSPRRAPVLKVRQLRKRKRFVPFVGGMIITIFKLSRFLLRLLNLPGQAGPVARRYLANRWSSDGYWQILAVFRRGHDRKPDAH